MKEYLKKNGIRLGIILLVILLVAFISSQALSGGAGFLTNFILNVREPISKAATAAGDLLEGIYGYVFRYEELQAENEALRIQLAEAQEAAREGSEAVEENRRYETLLGFAADNPDYGMEQARITAWSPNNWESLFQISKGSLSGIEAGDAVITEYGAFVGQVTEVGTSSATVRTVIDVNTSVGVLVGADGSAAMLAGDYALMGEGLVSVTWLTEGAQLFLDDEILTSGSGGLIPSGLVVGTVSSIQTEAAGQTEYGIIAPAADLDSLVQVFVIKDFGETAAQETQPVETPAASPSPSPSAAPAAPVTGG